MHPFDPSSSSSLNPLRGFESQIKNISQRPLIIEEIKKMFVNRQDPNIKQTMKLV